MSLILTGIDLPKTGERVYAEIRPSGGRMMDIERAKILLKATYDLLKRQDESPFVLNILDETAVWDGVECDGYCLMEEIEEWLGLAEE